jgi:hypothetical protein
MASASFTLRPGSLCQCVCHGRLAISAILVQGLYRASLPTLFPRPARLPAGHKEGEEIEWNFAKFLIDKHGHAVKRYGSDFLYHGERYHREWAGLMWLVSWLRICHFWQLSS